MIKQYEAFKGWLYNKMKTDLDDLYDELHAAQKEKELLNNKETIKNAEQAIKTYKANRLWYDISKWSTNEKIARLWIANLYALLCGISIFASIAALGIPLAAGLLFVGIFTAATITFSINLSSLWDNIAKLFDETKENTLTGFYEYGYKAFSWILLGTSSILATGFALSTVKGALGVGFLSYWQFFPILFIFATTAYAIQGLYTQEPRKWFKSFQTYGFVESLLRTAIRLWYGMGEPKVGDLPRNEWIIPETSFSSGLARVTLFTVFFSATLYASYAFAPYAAEVTIQLLVDFLSHATAGALMSSGSMALAPVAPIVALIFILGSACYNASLSGRLAILGGKFLGQCGNVFMQPYESAPLKDKFALQIALTVTLILPVYCFLHLITKGFIAAAKKEYSCWTEAKSYARAQYIAKDTRFILPHFIGRLLYNHMPVWGAINAVNNGALTTYSKFGGEDIKFNELSQTQMTEAGLSGATGFTRSYGFFWLTKGPRDHEMKNMRKAMTLEDDEGKKDWCQNSYFWRDSESSSSESVHTSASSSGESPIAARPLP